MNCKILILIALVGSHCIDGVEVVQVKASPGKPAQPCHELGARALTDAINMLQDAGHTIGGYSHGQEVGCANATRLTVTAVGTTTSFPFCSIKSFQTECCDACSSADDDQATAKRKPHCFVFHAGLYGDHSEERVQEALELYKYVSLPSIKLSFHRARQQGGGRELEAIALLAASDAYSEQTVVPLNDMDGLEVVVGTPTQLQASMVDRVQNGSCSSVSFVRLDADDMLSETGLSDIYSRWREIEGNSTNDGSSSVLVSGATTLYGLDMSANVNNSAVNCQFHFPREVGAHNSPAGVPRFFSLGETVTLPSALWLKHFPGQYNFGSHFQVYEKVSDELSAYDIDVFQQSVTKGGLYLKTPLSSHFDCGDCELCTNEYLERQLNVLGPGVAEIILGNSEYLPRFSEQIMQENEYLRKQSLGSLVAKLQRRVGKV